jgi:hypothetical protein
MDLRTRLPCEKHDAMWYRLFAPFLLLACADAAGGPPMDHDHEALDASTRGDASSEPSADAEAPRDAGGERDASVLDAGRELAPESRRAASIPIGIENVNDSPLKDADYRALLRFVPDEDVTIDRFYFGFKLRGADCWDAGVAEYGAGDGGLLEASLVEIDPTTGLPAAELASETVNGCERHDEALAELGAIPVLVWVNTPATLRADTMYGLVVRNVHDAAAQNFFSFNMPLAATELAGPHARNELSPLAEGGIMALDPREHVAWSEDGGESWHYGSENGQYRSYLNDHDTDHPATRMPQYGYRREGGSNVGPQPYYAYGTTCTGCELSRTGARSERTFTLLGGFTADDEGVGSLSIENTSSGESAACTPAVGFGFCTCQLATPIHVAVGEDYTLRATGTVEVMEMDFSQRQLFPEAGFDLPSLWAGPLSAQF